MSNSRKRRPPAGAAHAPGSVPRMTPLRPAARQVATNDDGITDLILAAALFAIDLAIDPAWHADDDEAAALHHACATLIRVYTGDRPVTPTVAQPTRRDHREGRYDIDGSTR